MHEIHTFQIREMHTQVKSQIFKGRCKNHIYVFAHVLGNVLETALVSVNG